MSIARVTEVISSSSVSFEDAIQQGIERANKTLNNVKGAWVRSQKIECDDQGNIAAYRVNLKVTFVLED